LPSVPWFALANVYHEHRDAYLQRNGGFIVRGYQEWLVRHVVQPVAPALHPLHAFNARADQIALARACAAGSATLGGDAAQLSDVSLRRRFCRWNGKEPA